MILVSVDFADKGCTCCGWVGEGSFRKSCVFRLIWPDFILKSGSRRFRGKRPVRSNRACWGWVGEGSFRKSACFNFQYGCHGYHLEIGFRWFCREWLLRLNQFWVCMLRVSRGKVPFGNRRISIFNMATILGWGVMLALRCYFGIWSLV
jgi:hypothetical protein